MSIDTGNDSRTVWAKPIPTGSHVVANTNFVAIHRGNFVGSTSCRLAHSGPIWGVRGGIGPKGARGLVLVSIPRVLGMGNRLGPFSDTSD